MSAEPATVPCAATVAVVATPVPAAAPPAAAVSTDDLKEANTTLSAKSAIEIFVAKHSHTSRDALSCKLAGDYGITSKSVRDIWNMRTWGWATVPHWTEADKRRYLDDRLCPACRRLGVQTLETACERCTVRCTVTKRRGRPPGIKETKPRKRASGFGFEEVKNHMPPGFHNAQFLPNMNIVGFSDMMGGGVNADGTPVSGAPGAAASGGQGGLNAQQQQQLMLSSQLLQQQLQVFPPGGNMDPSVFGGNLQLQQQAMLQQQWQWQQIMQQQMGMGMIPPDQGQPPQPPGQGQPGPPGSTPQEGAVAPVKEGQQPPPAPGAAPAETLPPPTPAAGAAPQQTPPAGAAPQQMPQPTSQPPPEIPQ